MEKIPETLNANNTIVMERWNAGESPDIIHVRYHETPEDSQEEEPEMGVEINGFANDEPSWHERGGPCSPSKTGNDRSDASSGRDNVGAAGRESEEGDDTSGNHFGDPTGEESGEGGDPETEALVQGPSSKAGESENEVDRSKSSWEEVDAGTFAGSGDNSLVPTSNVDIDTGANESIRAFLDQAIDISGFPRDVQQDLDRILFETTKKLSKDISSMWDEIIQCLSDHCSRNSTMPDEASRSIPPDGEEPKGTIRLGNGSTVCWNDVNEEANTLNQGLGALAAPLPTILGMIPNTPSKSQAGEDNTIECTLPFAAPTAPNDQQIQQTLQQSPIITTAGPAMSASVVLTKNPGTTARDIGAGASALSPPNNFESGGVPNYSAEISKDLTTIETLTELSYPGSGIAEELNENDRNIV
ncbi:hypothetical protein FRC03_007229 [Tulasnella sp. 419]|nr:hypothetical protein FRC03_007229 [Tulasnella sp. 419]